MQESGDTRQPLVIDDHRELVTKQKEIFAALNARPGLMELLAVNPVAALQEAGVSLSPDAMNHIFRTLQHTRTSRLRRADLEGKLEAQLGYAPRVSDSAWLRQVLFERLQLAPLETEGATPVYKPVLRPEVLKKLEALRPTLRPVPKSLKTKKPLHGVQFKVQLDVPTRRRLDLDAPVSALPPAPGPPKEMTIESLYFYKDQHPLVRDILELALLEQQSLPFETPDGYRQVKDGKKRHFAKQWIRQIRLGDAWT